MAMLFKVIMIVAALFALFGLRLSRDYYARFIMVLMIMSVLLTFLPFPEIKTGGLVLYEVCLILTMVYALLKNGLGDKKRILLMLMVLPVALAMLFELNHWPAVNIMYGLTGISLLAFLVICFSGIRSFYSEFGILVIIVGDALIHVLIYMEWGLYNY